MFGITAVWAQLERAILKERVKAGMERARREGRRLGRPKVADTPSVARDWPMVRRRIESREISRREAARLLHVSEQSVRRMLAAGD